MKGFLILCLNLDDQKYGGVQTRIRNYIQELPKYGYDPVLISFGNYDKTSFTMYYEVPLYCIPKRSIVSLIKFFFFILFKHHITLIHVLEGSTGIAQIVYLLLAKILFIRTGVSVYSGELIDMRTYQLRSRKYLFFNITLFLARRIAVNSKATAGLLPKFKNRIRVVYPGVSLDLLKQPTQPSPFRKKYKILFVGRHFRRKGIDDILVAVKLLKAKLKSLECIFVGNDVKTRGNRLLTDMKRYEMTDKTIDPDKIYFLTQFYKKLSKHLNVEKSVTFAGRQKILAPYYSNADIVVLPSKTVSPIEGVEGFGNVLIEAGLFNKPTIGTYHFGIPEAVINNETGLLVPENNAKELSKAMFYLLTNNKKAKEMGNTGYKRVMKNFTSASSTKKLLNIFG